MELSTILSSVVPIVKLLNALGIGDFKSQSIKDFNELKSYIRSINYKVDTLILQNKIILDKLDKLPNEILRITNTVVSNQLLLERYTNIQGRITFFTAIDDWAEWENTYEGWKDYYEDLNYIFLREHRLGHMPYLIPACELAIAVYKDFSLPVISVLLENKLNRLDSACEILKDNMQGDLDSLLSLLNNKSYISSHSFNNEIDDVSTVPYIGVSHKTRTENYTVQICRDVDIGCCRPARYCKNEIRTRQVPDTEYNKRYDEHLAEVEKKHSILMDSAREYKEVSLIINQLKSYENSLIRENDRLIAEEAKLVSPGVEELLSNGLMSSPFNLSIKRPRDCYPTPSGTIYE